MATIPSKIFRLVSKVLFCALCLMVMAGCGKKGNPTMKSFEKPEPVKSMSAVHRDGKVIVSWSYPKQGKIIVRGFYVERAEGQEAFQNMGFVKAESTQYVDEHFETGKEYRYKIRVYSMRDILSDDSAELKVLPLKLPEPPQGLAYHITNDSVEITWDKLPDDIRYNLYRGFTQGEFPPSPINAAPLEKPLYKDAVFADRPVFYVVRSVAVSSIMNEGIPSSEMAIDPESFVPARPADLRWVRAENKVYLTWKENAETWVKGYRIYRKTAASEFMPAGDVKVPLFVDEEPVTQHASYYVTALGPVKESPPSEVVVVNP